MLGLSAYAQTTYSNIPPSSPTAYLSGVVGTGQLGTVIGQQILVIQLTGVQSSVLLNSGANGTTTPRLWTLLDTSQN